MPESQFAFVGSRPDPFQVPAVPCDRHGFVKPLSAEDRMQRAFWSGKDCVFDPQAALNLPRERTVVAAPPREIVETALAPVWSRIKRPCHDPRAKDRFVSEIYPMSADSVRDDRPPTQQVGAQSRFDGRDPVDVYKHLHGDDWVNEGQRRVTHVPGFY